MDNNHDDFSDCEETLEFPELSRSELTLPENPSNDSPENPCDLNEPSRDSLQNPALNDILLIVLRICSVALASLGAWFIYTEMNPLPVWLAWPLAFAIFLILLWQLATAIHSAIGLAPAFIEAILDWTLGSLESFAAFSAKLKRKHFVMQKIMRRFIWKRIILISCFAAIGLGASCGYLAFRYRVQTAIIRQDQGQWQSTGNGVTIFHTRTGETKNSRTGEFTSAQSGELATKEFIHKKTALDQEIETLEKAMQNHAGKSPEKQKTPFEIMLDGFTEKANAEKHQNLREQRAKLAE